MALDFDTQQWQIDQTRFIEELASIFDEWSGWGHDEDRKELWAMMARAVRAAAWRSTGALDDE